jgi:YD repeat-containing protein
MFLGRLILVALFSVVTASCFGKGQGNGDGSAGDSGPGAGGSNGDAANLNYVYDPQGRLIRVAGSNGSSVSYQYDVVGNLIRIESVRK